MLLVGEVLADSITDAHPTALELDHANCNAIDVKHQIRPPLFWPFQRDLFSNGEVIRFRVMPIDQSHGGGGLIGFCLYLNPVAQQGIHLAIGFIEANLVDVGCSSELKYGAAYLRCAVATTLEVITKDLLFDVAFVSSLRTTAEVEIVEVLMDQLDHPLLGDAFEVNSTHAAASNLLEIGCLKK